MNLEYPVGEMNSPVRALYKGRIPRINVQGELDPESPYQSRDAGSNFEIVGSSDTRKKITNTSPAPFRYICQMLMKLSDGQTYVGTGFFIGPKTILTAGHNVWDDFSNTKVPNSNISISPGRNGSSLPFGAVNPVNVVMSHPGFSASDFSTAKDYAILHLGSTLGNTTGYFGRGVWAKDALGSIILKTGNLPLGPSALHLNLCGYPGDKGGELQYSSYNMGFSLHDNGKILSYLNDTKGGHSGSPVWIKRDPSLGGRVVVGIHIARGPWASSPSGTVQYNKAVLINNEVRNFIVSNLR